MKKIIIIISILSCSIVALKLYNIESRASFKYSQEYIVGQGNIKGEVDIEYFSNRGKDFDTNGYAVFKNPKKAFSKLKEDYKNGILLIKKEFGLEDLSQSNYELYGTYGWQVTTGTKEEQQEALFISAFMDIYENSFKR